MGSAKSRREPGGFTLVDVLVGAAILAIGLLGALSAYSTGYFDTTASGGLSKAAAYARQEMEGLRNQPFNPGPLTAGDSLEGGDFNRTWTITQIAGTVAPNRLVRIAVAVTWRGRGGRPQAVTLETMRAE